MTVGSTNKITVPVAGDYIVGYHMLSEVNSTTVIVYINGATVNGLYTQATVSGNGNFSAQNIVRLGINDYIQFYIAGGRVHGNYSYNRMYAYKLG